MLPEKWRNPPCYAQACPAKGAQAAFCKGRFCCGVRLPRRRSGAAKTARAQRTLGYFSSKLCAASRCAYPAFCLERAAACPQVFCHSRPVCVARVAIWIAFSIKGGDCMRFCPLSRFHSGWRSQPLRISRVLFGAGSCLPASFLPWRPVCVAMGLYFL